jgi:N-acetylglucosamine kinase-like BadF-type ATPase
MDVSYILGVDGGKSKTICLVADGYGRIIGQGNGGSSDKYYVSTDQALSTISSAVDQALQQASISRQSIECGCFGLAGADWPEDFHELENSLSLLGLAKMVLVKNDAQIALKANLEYKPGVVVVAGTQLAAAARTKDGDDWFSGWFSVEGAGGIRTGYLAFWAVLQAVDGRNTETSLTPPVLRAAGVSNPIEMLRALSRGEYRDTFYASLAPIVFEVYEQTGDEVAAGIIRTVGMDISRWGIGLLRRFELLDEGTEVVLCGGLFRSQNALLFEIVSSEIHAHFPLAVVRIGQREPILGALFYALEQIGQPLTPDIIGNLISSLPEPGFFRTA